MHPLTHMLIGWTVANAASLEKRDRVIVTVAGIVPDMDGLGVLVDYVSEWLKKPVDLYGEYHHVFTHNVGFAIFLALIAALLARRKIAATFLATLSFHLHLLGDIVGSRGPDGYQWPIPYLLPFSHRGELAWQYQWGLKAWPNVTLTLLLLGLALYWSWKRGRSPIEILSDKADRALTSTLRARFGDPLS